MRVRWSWLRDFLRRLLPARRESEWRVIDLAQVETEQGFRPVVDLPFNEKMLALASTRRVKGGREAVRRQAAEQKDRVRGSRERLVQGEASERTYCERCIAQGRSSQTYCGPVYARPAPWEPFYDGEQMYHAHDPNEQRLTYVCSNGHRWEVPRWPKCWCGWTAKPQEV